MNYHLHTRLIHAGERIPRVDGAINLPIYQSVNYQSEETVYLRYNNTPQHQVLHAKLADLEGTQQALVTSSGMAAISAALLGLLNRGDHLLAQSCLYGGTFHLLSQQLPAWGIEVDFIDANSPESWAAALKPTTRLLYAESLSNPLLELGCLEEMVAFAQEQRLLTLIDNTLATPVNFRPAHLGFDVVLHSATKYLNGHSDVAAGVICGRRAEVERIGLRLKSLGACLDPNSIFLLLRGLKTLGLRLGQQNATALRLAQWLEHQPQVARVYYPGLSSHPSHPRALRYMSGGGGVLSFELKASLNQVQEFIHRLELFTLAPSLGGVESLITLPARTSHASLSPEQRRGMGLSEGLIRLAVGLEDAEDLRHDLDLALNSQLLA